MEEAAFAVGCLSQSSRNVAYKSYYWHSEHERSFLYHRELIGVVKGCTLLERDARERPPDRSCLGPAHDEVYGRILGLSQEERQGWREQGVI